MVKYGENIIGQYRAKVTSKGRVAFPKKLRRLMGDKIILTRGYDGCLIVISPQEWKNLIGGIEQKPLVFEAARETTRFLLGNAAEFVLDRQGRFVIPSHLKEYARVKREVIFLGLGRYVEVWEKEKWKKYQGYLGKNIKQISERLENDK